MLIVPYVPVDITVHLGRPDRDARNVTYSSIQPFGTPVEPEV